MNEFDMLRKRAERLRETYPVGTRIVCLDMDDPHGVPSGTRGTVAHIDDIATIHVDWDNGSGLGLAYGVDHYRKLTQEELEAENQGNDIEPDDGDMTMNM